MNLKREWIKDNAESLICEPSGRPFDEVEEWNSLERLFKMLKENGVK